MNREDGYRTQYHETYDEKRSCKCGKNNWVWDIDESLKSWIKCQDCQTSLFDEGIGVILINSDKTDISKINENNNPRTI